METLAEFDFVIEHRPGRLHSNVDGVSRPFCKQCMDKPTKVKWVDELERADELTEPLGVQWIVVTPELSAQEVREFQMEDSDLAPYLTGSPPNRRHPWTILGNTPLRQETFGGSVLPFICPMAC